MKRTLELQLECVIPTRQYLLHIASSLVGVPINIDELRVETGVPTTVEFPVRVALAGLSPTC
jgi:hypothetical protein